MTPDQYRKIVDEFLEAFSADPRAALADFDKASEAVVLLLSLYGIHSMGKRSINGALNRMIADRVRKRAAECGSLKLAMCEEAEERGMKFDAIKKLMQRAK